MEEEMEDNITEDPDSAVDDDEMSPAEAGFSQGAEDDKSASDKEDDDEVR